MPRLRPVDERDVLAIASACTDVDIQRYIPGLPDPYTERDAREYVASAIAGWADGKLTWTILGRYEEFCGVVSVTGRGRSIGYWVAPHARGQGLATAAVRQALDRAVRAWTPELVSLVAHPENLASQRVAEKAGFQFARVMEDHPRFRDGSTTALLYEFRP